MEAKAIKKPLQKNITKMMPKITPKWSQRGSQNEANIVKNNVSEAPSFKGGSQVAYRHPPGSVLERFWNLFGNIFVSVSDIHFVNFVGVHVHDFMVWEPKWISPTQSIAKPYPVGIMATMGSQGR